MKKNKSSRRNAGPNVPPSRTHWWWRKTRLKRALKDNRQLDHFFYWKAKGRKSPDGKKWTPAQRRGIEIALWLYELDARISGKYLFGQPAYLLPPAQLSSVVSLGRSAGAPTPQLESGGVRRSFKWTWIEYFDKRNETKASKLTRAELNGIIAAMKYCLAYFIES